MAKVMELKEMSQRSVAPMGGMGPYVSADLPILVSTEAAAAAHPLLGTSVQENNAVRDKKRAPLHTVMAALGIPPPDDP